MLTKQQFSDLLKNGPLLLDGATGSNLQKMGMPRGCCTEEWILNHPEAILDLQRRYAEAGSHIVYAPTFQAQPIPLSHVKLDRQTEAINAMLVALSKKAAPGLLVAGDLTTMATFIDSYDTALFDTMVENYRRQIAYRTFCPQDKLHLLRIILRPSSFQNYRPVKEARVYS